MFAGEEEDQENQHEQAVGDDGRELGYEGGQDGAGGTAGDGVDAFLELSGLDAESLERQGMHGFFDQVLHLLLVEVGIGSDFGDGGDDDKADSAEEDASEQDGGDQGEAAGQAETMDLDHDDGREGIVEEDGEDEGDQDGGEEVESTAQSEGGKDHEAGGLNASELWGLVIHGFPRGSVWQHEMRPMGRVIPQSAGVCKATGVVQKLCFGGVKQVAGRELVRGEDQPCGVWAERAWRGAALNTGDSPRADHWSWRGSFPRTAEPP